MNYVDILCYIFPYKEKNRTTKSRHLRNTNISTLNSKEYI